MFDWKKPALRAISKIDAIELAKAFQRLCVNEGLLRAIGRGRDASGQVGLMAKALQALLSPIVSSKAAPTVLNMACKEVLEVSEAVMVLAGGVCADGNSMIDKLSHTSIGKVVRHLVSQTPFWAAEEKRMRQMSVATKTFIPEITDVMASVAEESVSLEKLAEISRRMTTWHEGLGTGGSKQGFSRRNLAHSLKFLSCHRFARCSLSSRVQSLVAQSPKVCLQGVSGQNNGTTGQRRLCECVVFGGFGSLCRTATTTRRLYSLAKKGGVVTLQ